VPCILPELCCKFKLLCSTPIWNTEQNIWGSSYKAPSLVVLSLEVIAINCTRFVLKFVGTISFHCTRSLSQIWNGEMVYVNSALLPSFTTMFFLMFPLKIFLVFQIFEKIEWFMNFWRTINFDVFSEFLKNGVQYLLKFTMYLHASIRNLALRNSNRLSTFYNVSDTWAIFNSSHVRNLLHIIDIFFSSRNVSNLILLRITKIFH